MRKVDKLYYAAWDVATKTTRHPDLAAAIVMLKKCLLDLEKYHTAK